MNKMKIGLVFDEKDTAKAFVCQNSPYGRILVDSEHEFVYDTPIITFYWIIPNTYFKGHWLNFVYTVERIRDTDWFDHVIRPMQMVGTAAIDH